jgi:beta-N-acetylhexosaminidase
MPIADRLDHRAAVLLASLIGIVVLAGCAPAVETGHPRPAPVLSSVPPEQTPGQTPEQQTPEQQAPKQTPEQAWAAEKLASMTLEQKVGQLFVDITFGTSAEAADRRNEPYGATPAELVARYHLGGVIYFDWSNGLGSPAQITRLSNGLQTTALGPNPGVPLIICTDQENGTITRIGPPFTDLPSARELGITASAQDAMAAARVAGSELNAMGINTDLAPVADVNVNPANPVIGPRSFSADPAVAAKLTGAQVTGYQQESVSATAKHFPGHGDTTVDSHIGLPVVTHSGEQWARLDAPPFRSAIAADVDMIMTGHLAFPLLDPSGDPATLSQPIITGLLRDVLGFRGVVMTDSLRMQGVRARYPDDRIPVLALKAGVDVLLMPQNLDIAYRSVLAAVRSGELTEQRIDESVTRILELKFRRGIVAQPLRDEAAAGAVVGSAAHREIATQLAAQVAKAARGGG